MDVLNREELKPLLDIQKPALTKESKQRSNRGSVAKPLLAFALTAGLSGLLFFFLHFLGQWPRPPRNSGLATAPVLEGIVTGGEKPYCLISGKVLRVGDQLDHQEIVTIEKEKVVLKDSQGEVTTIKKQSPF
jgi:hypothetical protein